MKNFQNDRLFECGYDPAFSRLHAQHMADSPFVAGASLANVGALCTASAKAMRRRAMRHGIIIWMGAIVALCSFVPSHA